MSKNKVLSSLSRLVTVDNVVFKSRHWLYPNVGGNILDSIVSNDMKKEEQRRKKENEFLDKNIFVGLNNLNDGFDSPDIKYFSEQDFEIVIQRVKKLGLGIYGIEPRKNGDFYGLQIHEQVPTDPTDPNWYERSFQDFKDTGEKLQYAATYYIPDK